MKKSNEEFTIKELNIVSNNNFLVMEMYNDSKNVKNKNAIQAVKDELHVGYLLYRFIRDCTDLKLNEHYSKYTWQNVPITANYLKSCLDTYRFTFNIMLEEGINRVNLYEVFKLIHDVVCLLFIFIRDYTDVNINKEYEVEGVNNDE